MAKQEFQEFDTELFILEIEQRPSIWDITTKEYSDKIVKKKCWRELVEIFGDLQWEEEEMIEFGKYLSKKRMDPQPFLLSFADPLSEIVARH